jgi:putative Mg2+ transporter-C (MgtC) family protein
LIFISNLISNNSYYIEMFFKLLLAAIIGGLIGFQRENSNRPAGLRTHILVCVGSALVMITSEYIFNTYRGLTNMDPARLGAQVISGIGFLGAGTILRDGSTIKGLTTAAGLWTVSCIGIAIGSGFYFGGVAAAILVYFTLLISKDWEVPFEAKGNSKRIRIYAENRPGIIGDIEAKFAENEVIIRSIKIVPSKNNDNLRIFLFVKYPGSTAKGNVISSLCNTKGVVKAD